MFEVLDIRDLICYKNALALRAGARFYDIISVRILEHGILEVRNVVRQDKRLRQEFKVLCSMLFPQLSEMLVHIILACHLGRLWPMIYFLIPCHTLVNDRLYVATGPHNGPLLLVVGHPSKPVVLECIPDELDVDVVVEFEVELFVCWFIRANRQWVDVGTEHHVFLVKLAQDCRRQILPLFICLVKLAREHRLQHFDLLLDFLLFIRWPFLT